MLHPRDYPVNAETKERIPADSTKIGATTDLEFQIGWCWEEISQLNAACRRAWASAQNGTDA